jgi:3-methyladenine DNA glycosylase AlkD
MSRTDRQEKTPLDYLSSLIDEFTLHGCGDRASAMSNYMRNRFQFFGVAAPKRKEIQRSWIKSLPDSWDHKTKWELVHLLWNQPQREIHYVAIDWMNSWKIDKINTETFHHFYGLLTTNSWWDSIDGLAPGIIGKCIASNPKEGYRWINIWRKDSNFWVRRVCIIFQLKYREKLDFELLTSVIRENLSDKEFFIQKAIGWSLRQHAKYDAKTVLTFVATTNMVGLAKREALKHIKHLAQ